MILLLIHGQEFLYLFISFFSFFLLFFKQPNAPPSVRSDAAFAVSVPSTDSLFVFGGKKKDFLVFILILFGKELEEVCI